MRDPNFITPNRCPADTCSPSVSRQTIRRARMPTICRDDDGAAGPIEPDLGPLVQLAGLLLIRGQELARMILHPRDGACQPGSG